MGNRPSVTGVAQQQVEEPKNHPIASEVRPQVEDTRKPPPGLEGPQLEEARKLPPNAEVTSAKEINTSNNKQPVGNPPDHTQKKEVQKEEKKPGPKSHIISARDLSITWSGDPRYWSWLSWKEPASNTHIEVAHLLNVCWLEVHGKFDMSKLSSGLVYEIVFEVMLKDPAYGWNVPVNLKLVNPLGQTQEHREKLVEKLRGQWIELHVGDFSRTNNGTGEVQFSLFEYGGQWKRGLIIKGAVIRPKTSMSSLIN
ncbi:uncharacterized protein PHLOEM PROTEIN 2-LIKE A4-like [Aristolochia californica]|uniref:uncharacterized protein PHLOEM PROTEIN 2-LIKE A4-like n=1 Tax=Aristolochia californica TaxID=171875 RepID=UPI0035E27A8D